MSVLLPLDVHERRAAVTPGQSLAALADGLAAELQPLEQALAREQLPVPAQKARLTRRGGRCPVHGVLLDFDPWQPHHHHCSRCGQAYVGQEHDDWWAMNAQLWTVERAVHAAALHLLRGAPSHAHLAESILCRLAEQYTSWPNRDNVLGPSRPFFSTYLESIWLLNVAHALALLEASGRTHIGGTVRDRLLDPSSALIAGFFEGRSNRQVWNEIAILSAWTLLGRESDIASRLNKSGSLPWLLEHGLLDDGSWYEGENYHLFAHRGLWYGVQWMRATGRDLHADLDARFHRGFAAPFVGVLPDETLPARRDSQYAVSIRQWRVAEYLELGLAHRPQRELSAWLARLYAPMLGGHDLPRAGRRLSTADAERHDPPGSLSRADLSWRALLMASNTEVAAGAMPPTSAYLLSQGLAVIRRDAGRVYVALEGGATGGGHGHPDRLALTLQSGGHRLLDDPGTGSYVERRLHWYRSTLAHHAPLIDGQSQERQPATLLAFEDRGGAGWIRKSVDGLAPGVNATRTVVVCDGHLVDVLEWEADRVVTLSLPIAAQAQVHDVHTWRPVDRAGAGGLEDGFDFLEQVSMAGDVGGDAWRRDGTPFALSTAAARAWYATSVPARVLRAEAPAPPLAPSHRSPEQPADTPRALARHWLEVEAARGCIVGVWAWAADGPVAASPAQVTAVRFPRFDPAHIGPDRADVAHVHTADGTISAHRATDTGWQIGLTARHARSSIDLDVLPRAQGRAGKGPDLEEGFVSALRPGAIAARGALAVPRVSSTTVGIPRLTDPMLGARLLELGESAYRQTEQPWHDAHEHAHAPRAQILLATTQTHFVVRVRMHMGDTAALFGTGAEDEIPDNPLDNERADVNVSGVQWYVTADGGTWQDAGLVVPLSTPDGRCRVTPLVPASRAGVLGASPTTSWCRLEQGWQLQIAWELPHVFQAESHALAEVGFQVVINEAAVGRTRRLGQLALAGGGGFAYLRGDREQVGDTVTLRFESALEMSAGPERTTPG